MTVAYSGQFQIIDKWTHTDNNNISVPTDQQRYIFTKTFTDGSGDDQNQDQFHGQRTVSPGEGNDDLLDLAGVLTDAFGNTLTFATIKKIILINNATTAGEDLRLGGPSAGTTGSLISDLFDGDTGAGLKIRAGYGFALCGGLAGYTVTGGSADILVVTNRGTGNITYDIIIAGTRA